MPIDDRLSDPAQTVGEFFRFLQGVVILLAAGMAGSVDRSRAVTA